MKITCEKCETTQTLTSDNIVEQTSIKIEFSRCHDMSEIEIKCTVCGNTISESY